MKNPIIKKDIDNIIKKIDITQFDNKTVLISGATGMLARYIVFFFLELSDYHINCKVVALCRNKEKADKIFADYKGENLFFLIQEVEQEIVYEGNIDYIIHTASNAVTPLFFTNPVETSTANLVGTINLLNLAQNKKLQGFLFFSSGAVYGDDKNAEHDVKEQEYYTIDALKQENCYALSKKMAENLCVSYYQQYGIPVKIVRIAHTYGPSINLEDGHIYSDFTRTILRNEDFVIRGSGENKRAFCYIEDAVVAFLLILLKGENGEAYNMANNEQFISIKELANRLNQGLDLKKQIVIQGKKSDNSNEVSIETKKLENIGWHPVIDVVEGFKRTVKGKRWEENRAGKNSEGL